jgi:hypothetical protein
VFYEQDLIAASVAGWSSKPTSDERAFAGSELSTALQK